MGQWLRCLTWDAEVESDDKQRGDIKTSNPNHFKKDTMTSEAKPKIPWESVRPARDDLVRVPDASHPHHGAAMLAGSTVLPSLDPLTAVMDREAVKNVIAAYSVYVDEFQYEAFWDQCFWEDATLKILLPDGEQNVGFEADMPLPVIKGRLKDRHDKFKAHHMQRRRIMGSTLFLKQSADEIHALQQALLVNVNSQRPPVDVVMPVIYEGFFEKRDGVWKIKRWIDCCDTVGDGGTEPKTLNTKK